MKLLNTSVGHRELDEVLAQELVVRIRLSRVFVFRIWLGVRLVRFGMWVIGGRVEVLDES
jgi:hypothetical protein